MADNETTVETIFEVADKSTAPLAQIAKAGQDTGQAIETAKKRANAGPAWMQKLSPDERERLKALRDEKSLASARSSLAPTEPKPERQKKSSWLDRMDATERQSYIEAQGELRARKARVKTLRYEESAGMAQARGGEMAAALLASSEGGAASAFTKLAAKAEAMGFGLSAFGGKVGSLGEKLAGIATKGVALGAAFEAGTALGDKLTEMQDRADERMADEKNDAYVKSLGYASQEIYNETNKMHAAAQAHSTLSKKAEAAAAQLAKMPIPETIQAMEDQQHAMITAAQKITGLGESMEDSKKAIEEAFERSAAHITAEANAHAELEAKLRFASQSLEALPFQATVDQQKEFNEKTAQLVEKLGLMSDQVPGAIKTLQEMAGARGSFDNVWKEAAAKERKDALDEESVHRDLKKIKIKGTGKEWQYRHGADRAEQLNRLAAMEMERRRANGVLVTPTDAREYREKLKTADLSKEKKYYDFRGSRFDITQAFADVDPDRIAVAFANDLAGLGERRVQSSFAPIFAV